MRMRRSRTGIALCALAGVTGAGVWAAATAGGASHEAAAAPRKATPDRLVRFGGCVDLQRYASRRSLALADRWGIGPYPVRWVGGGPMFREVMPMGPTPTGAMPAPTAAPAPDVSARTPGTGGADHSGTNVQEAGVDEPDLALADAKHIITVAGGALRVFDTGDTPRQVGSLALTGLSSDAQMLRVGDRVMIMSSGWGGGVATPAADVVSPRVAYMPGQETTVVRLVDVSDPAAPRLVQTLSVDGALVGARRPGAGAVRLVVRSVPDPIPMYGPGGSADLTRRQATERNRRAIRRAPARTWLPAMTIRTGSKSVRRTAVGCRDVARSTQFAGLGTLTVLTIDPARGLEPVDRDAVMTDAQTIYGSARSLYITTPRYVNPSQSDPAKVPDGLRTQIHRFDISAPGETGYSSSGDVPGFVLNQFSLSEKDGVLRVASTSEPSWVGDQRTETESYVTTLREEGRKLVTVGRLGGLGRNERIYGVRFIGDMGYVVTFRQMDPLHVIDVSNPAAPVQRGELKIPGYSAYLHPVGPGLLLGVGQDADDQGRAKGTQVSLFDVSNPAAPRRVQNVVIPEGWSEVESDHHAFLYWEPTGLAVVPVSTYDGAQARSGAVGMLVRPDGITRVRTVEQPAVDGQAPTIRRTLVVGDRVFTVSDRGVQAARLDNLSPLGFTPYP
ncbi:MAG: beta-propeller domain-containing protein [Thermoleophilia bacterium]|nr:beta-propeller domain-containing protein [Thermoleophilia bacterium]